MRIIRFDQVRMANLAIVMSKSVNGVAKLHTQILKDDTFKNWYKIMPEKFNNKTNGITPRRWLVYSNIKLSNFITEKLGSDDWKYDLTKLKGLEKYLDDEKTLEEINQIKFENKKELAKYILENEGISINPNSIFDIQVKRIHEYKRQHLNLLHIINLYHKLKKNPDMDFYPTTFILGGKAAPGYFRAKAIIKLANEIARVINNDEEVNDKIKVVFVNNYRVSYGEKLFPAADISEQISTAGKEASGTGNMKFMLNGALTLGTYDGANIEIFENAGVENNYLFGAKVEELNYNKFGGYSALDLYNSNRVIKRVVDDLVNGFIPNMEKEGRQIYDSLITYNDEYFVLRDMENYIEAQEKIDRLYKNKEKWNEMALINIANSGILSDRTIAEYAEDIWFKGCEEDSNIISYNLGQIRLLLEP